jgi:hypothetical protein
VLVFYTSIIQEFWSTKQKNLYVPVIQVYVINILFLMICCTSYCYSGVFLTRKGNSNGVQLKHTKLRCSPTIWLFFSKFHKSNPLSGCRLATCSHTVIKDVTKTSSWSGQWLSFWLSIVGQCNVSVACNTFSPLHLRLRPSNKKKLNFDKLFSLSYLRITTIVLC